MKEKQQFIELIPKCTFDQCLKNIDGLAAIIFEKYNPQTEEHIKLEILSLIHAIEEDVYNSLSAAYKPETVSMMINLFHGYATHINYTVSHVVHEPKFNYYFKLFKDEAIHLKFNAIDTVFDLLQYKTMESDSKMRENAAEGGRKSSKKLKYLEKAIIDRITTTGDSNVKGLLCWLETESPLFIEGHEIEVDDINELIYEDGKNPIKYKSFSRYVTEAKKIIRSN